MNIAPVALAMVRLAAPAISPAKATVHRPLALATLTVAPLAPASIAERPVPASPAEAAQSVLDLVASYGASARVAQERPAAVVVYFPSQEKLDEAKTAGRVPAEMEGYEVRYVVGTPAPVDSERPSRAAMIVLDTVSPYQGSVKLVLGSPAHGVAPRIYVWFPTQAKLDEAKAAGAPAKVWGYEVRYLVGAPR